MAKPVPNANPYPFWSPLFWHGWRFGDWFGLCVRQRFRIAPRRWPIALIITLVTPLNSLLARLQRLTHGARIDAVVIADPPVFIIGHWRSGTTYLHELLALDSRLATPNTYQCFAPRHFLLTEWLFTRLGFWMLPRKRPMDNVVVGWDRPQEDEFALLTLAAPSPYLRMAFPNTPAPYMEFLDMEGCDARDLARFEAELRRFRKTLTWRTGKRILLKSPTHTGRIDFLARMFPGAKFIHLVRDPRALFPSTQRLWRSLDAVQGMQVPREEGLDDYVFECLTRMYRGFDRQRPLIPPRDICDLRYEALVEDPVREVRRVYDALGLPGFEAVLPALEAHATAQQGYSPNQHALDPAVEAEIRRRWAKYCKAFGY